MVVILVLFHLGEVAGQCRVDTLIQIQERDTVSILLEVSGLNNNDLSDPGQGVCGICVNFEHEFLGDLQIQLISPAGQSVQLTGPEGVFGLTQFTEWDVCFVRSSDAAVPDPGFTDRWSNNQLWGAFAGTYTGSYYPFFGSLEDFDLGSANGTWRLRFEDRTIFYAGLIKGYEIIFCDSSGIDCNPCDPGELVLSASQDSFCVEDSVIRLDVLSDYRIREDSQSYTTQVYLTNATGRILARGTSYDLSFAPPGDYRICGLSYFKPHDTLIPIVGDNWLEFQNEVRRGDKAVCLRYSNCLDIFIDDGPDTLVYESVICADDTLFFKDTFFTQSGRSVYQQAHKEICDSVFLIDIERVRLQPSISSSDTLTCAVDSVLLIGEDVGRNLNYTGRWRADSSGLILSFGDTLVVYQPGTYWYIISKDGREDSISVNIHRDSAVPSLQIVGDTINCSDTLAELTGVTNAIMPEFRWDNNGIQIGSSQILQTSSPGLYKLTIVDQNGCSTIGEFEVTMDTLLPTVTVNSDSIDCYKDSADIGLSSMDSITRLIWRGPGGFLDSVSNISVHQTGFYAFEVTGQNGCTLIDSIEIVSDLDTPELVLELDTLNCRNSPVNVILSGSENAEIQWFKGGSPIDTGRNVLIIEPGTYGVRVVGENGCLGERLFEIIQEIDAIGIMKHADSLDCRNDSVRVWLSSFLPIQSQNWRLPDGTALSGDTIFSRQAGMHYVEFIAPSGCIYVDSIFVRDIGEGLDIAVETDTLNCVLTESALNAFGPGPEISYTWIFKGDTISRTDSAAVNEPGTVILQARDSLGCSFIDTLNVLLDTARPTYFLSGLDTLTCDKREFQVMISSPELALVTWKRSGLIIGVSDSLDINLDGRYLVIVEGPNGCKDSSVFNIEMDTISPMVSIESDTLTCNNRSTLIRTIGGDLNWEYTWIAPNGDSISGDQYVVDAPGIYQLNVLNVQNGCTNSFRHRVIGDTVRPDIEMKDTTLSCMADTIRLELATRPTWQIITWSDTTGDIATGETAFFTSPGTYFVEVIGRNGCRIIDTFLIEEDRDAPRAEIAGGNLSCKDSAIILRATEQENVVGLEWSVDGRVVSRDSTLAISEPGRYQLRLEAANGCLDSVSYTVVQDTLKPLFILSKSGDLGCSDDSVVIDLEIDTVTGSSYRLAWVFPSGIRDTSLGSAISTKRQGVYIVEVTNITNGCLSIDSIQVDRSLDLPRLDSVTLLSPTCAGNGDGSIRLESILGSSPPFLVNFEDNGFDSTFYFESLAKGHYSVQIIDANGCLLDTIVILPEGDDIYVELGPDTTINLGDTLRVTPVRISDTTRLLQYDWQPETLLSPEDQFSTKVYPRAFTVFRLTILSETGCVAFDEIAVDVKNEVGVFVPNIISPDQDGINDFLEVYIGQGVEKVISVDVYDRWGEHVFSSVPGKEKWDGTFNNENCPNGVYVYSVLLQLKSGETFQFTGDVTLFR